MTLSHPSFLSLDFVCCALTHELWEEKTIQIEYYTTLINRKNAMMLFLPLQPLKWAGSDDWCWWVFLPVIMLHYIQKSTDFKLFHITLTYHLINTRSSCDDWIVRLSLQGQMWMGRREEEERGREEIRWGEEKIRWEYRGEVWEAGTGRERENGR